MSRFNDRPRLRDLRDDRRSYDPRRPSKKGSVAKVLWIVGLVTVASLFVSRMGCAARVEQANTLPPKKSLAGLKPKDLQQQTAEHGIEGGAAAGMAVVNAAKGLDAPAADAPEPEVRVTTGGFVVLRVRSSTPHVLPRDREQAIEEAKAEARKVLVEQGRVPAGNWKVSFDPDKVRDVAATDGEKKAWEENGLGSDRGWVEIEEVSLSHDTLRQERAKERTGQAGFWFGTVFLGLLAAYGFLRLDMWTKGYLTLILGVAVGGAVVAGIVALGLLVL
jgi:hypothetical protein